MPVLPHWFQSSKYAFDFANSCLAVFVATTVTYYIAAQIAKFLSRLDCNISCFSFCVINPIIWDHYLTLVQLEYGWNSLEYCLQTNAKFFLCLYLFIFHYDMIAIKYHKHGTVCNEIMPATTPYLQRLQCYHANEILLTQQNTKVCWNTAIYMRVLTVRPISRNTSWFVDTQTCILKTMQAFITTAGKYLFFLYVTAF